jgi:glyoxylase-like metal-dependent hydrolase (beta-lactamase superfamily II)
LAAVASLGLKLAWTLETHIHADHITAALHLKRQVGSKDRRAGDQPAALRRPRHRGGCSVRPRQHRLAAAAHARPHRRPFRLRLADRVFTGDALLIDGCGRTDFQNGDAATLYASVTGKLFSLADEYLVYPGHDYQERRVSSIGQEKRRNPRLGAGRVRPSSSRSWPA